MRGKPDDITIRAWARLMAAQHLALSAVERALKAAGLPPLAWYDVLLELERAGGAGMRPFALERAMLLAQYSVSRLIDRMERAGLVERRDYARDGRGQLVAITDRGKAMRRGMWPVYAGAIEQAVGRHLSAQQAGALDELLGRLVAGHRAEEVE